MSTPGVSFGAKTCLDCPSISRGGKKSPGGNCCWGNTGLSATCDREAQTREDFCPSLQIPKFVDLLYANSHHKLWHVQALGLPPRVPLVGVMSWR